VTCTHPIRIYDTAPTDAGLEVPCGKCTQCRIRRSSEWGIRVVHEMAYWHHTCFVRLSYNDEHLPKDEAVSKDELKQFLRRLRKRTGALKYLACGEYGETDARAHYHAILFGYGRHWDRDPRSVLGGAQKHTACGPRRGPGGGEIYQHTWNGKCWDVKYGPLIDCWTDLSTGKTKGYVTLGTVTYDSARYIAGYTLKSNIGHLGPAKGRKFHDGRTFPFQLVSNGLGKQWALDNREQLERKLTITHNGQEIGLPRYYAKVLEIPTERLLERSETHKEEIIEHYKTRGIDTTNLVGWVDETKRQRAKTQDARRKINESLRY